MKYELASPAAAVRVAAGLLVAVAGLAIAFRRVDFQALVAALRDAHWSWFAGAVAALIVSFLVRAWRWQLLLEPIERIGIEPLFSATMIGYFGNSVLPLRLGELMRAVAIGRRRGGLDASTALGSIGVERLLDVASALVVAAAVVPLAGGLGGGVGASAGAATLVAMVLVGLFWASRAPRVRRMVATRAEAGGDGRVAGLARSFLRGLLILGERPALLPIALGTVILWLIYGAVLWASARAAGLTLSPLDTGLVLVANTVAVSVPAAPGYVGTYHAAVVLVTSEVLGQPLAQAQVFAILAHASSWLPMVAIGALCLLRSSLRLADVRELAPEADAGGALDVTTREPGDRGGTRC